jgi:outer membrane protein
MLVPAAAQSQSAPQKFAFVNTQQVLGQAPGATEAQAKFNTDVESFNRQVQQYSDSLVKLEDTYSKEAAALSPAAREARQRALLQTKDTFEVRVASLKEQAEQRQFELMQPIMDNVRAALEELRVEGGYSFIFDVANSAFIVAADKNLDVTERVVAKMRAMSKAAPPTGPTTRPAGVQARPPRTPPTR